MEIIDKLAQYTRQDKHLILVALQTFTELTQALEKLEQYIYNDQNLCAWVSDEEFPEQLDPKLNTFREKAVLIYQQLHYLNNQEPKEIIVCAGFLGASKATLKQASIVNNLKLQFKQAILNSKQNPKIKLKELGLNRIHLKQCYRTIPILATAPTSISWTWANTKSIKKVTRQQAEQLLIKKGKDAGVISQLNKLYKLPDGEKLAIVQKLAPHLRTNIVFPKPLENTNKQKMMLKGALPILFPANSRTQPPRFKPLKPKITANKHRAKRNDVLIEEKEFLPAIHAHRYI